MSQNLHYVNHKKKLYMLEGDWSSLDRKSNSPALLTDDAVMGLRNDQGRYQELFKKYLIVATAAGMDIVSGKEVYAKRNQIFVACMRMQSEDNSK